MINSKDEQEKARNIRLPSYVWKALDEDAERCRRSANKHLEALLVTYYELDDVGIMEFQKNLTCLQLLKALQIQALAFCNWPVNRCFSQCWAYFQA